MIVSSPEYTVSSSAADDGGPWVPVAPDGCGAYPDCAMQDEPLRDYTPYLRHARRMSRLRRLHCGPRRERAWQTARRIAEFLHQRYHPERVLVFGSLLYPDLFGPRSDIDIAVEGIAWPEYLRAWNAAEEMSTEFKIDLIDTAIASAPLRRRIEQEGQCL